MSLCDALTDECLKTDAPTDPTDTVANGETQETGLDATAGADEGDTTLADGP